jgi:hypothetical protein
MAAKRGLNADIRIDDSGGTLRDISRSVKNVNFSRDIETIDATTFQPPGGDKEFIVSFTDRKPRSAFNMGRKARPAATANTPANA